jgi:hypothetical protein
LDIVSLILLGKAGARFRAIVGAQADNRLARPISGGPCGGADRITLAASFLMPLQSVKITPGLLLPRFLVGAAGRRLDMR